ncbi:TPA: hypothetical protein ACT96X_003075 [Legionella pneumophila]|uniref:hypothetical protein n=1 Tax=Legionella pneumophila TaxID=446 RepID=UPI000787D4E2|nr:hypothetical protein [Legionella pneumophila]HAU1192564.1 hypothetical protein [Legionella pneumophila]HAU1639534.1 hypothetical protein [Legionella pneumophila]HBD7103141.1 hypothetical protein [Legionella pneumophila]HCO4739653.1 hypothetical protein [Legionella pneumophila]HDU7930507.1 hypothetical protein [Legionella pneumophila]
MVKIIKNLGVIVFIWGLVSCSSDKCREYSKYTCDELENNVVFNVLFYFPNNDKEYHLGTAKGISECQDIAYDYADEKHLINNSGWSYSCCIQTKDSECEEAHT